MGVGAGNGGNGFLYEHADHTHQQWSEFEPVTSCPAWVKGKPCRKKLIWRNEPKKKVSA